MDRFQNKYRIPSARALWWDYGWNGAYFITICTKNMQSIFGYIVGDRMNLSTTGVIADICWHDIPHHSSHVELGDFVVMPNHIHGILIINRPNEEVFIEQNELVETGHALSLQMPSYDSKAGQDFLHTRNALSVHRYQQNRYQNIGNNTIPSIVGSYKSAVTKHANRLDLEYGWQPRYHDHIIRNDADYQRISNYIVNNPANWDNDKFNSE